MQRLQTMLISLLLGEKRILAAEVGVSECAVECVLDILNYFVEIQ